MTPMQLLQGIKNPQQFVMNMIGKNTGNPMIGQLMTLANQGKTNEVEQFARNICKEKGLDFDKDFANFMSTIKR